MKERILCSISTRGRNFSTLPMAIQSVITQTRKPDKLVIFDDNDDPVDLRNVEIYKELLPILELSGIEWSVLFGGKKGQHHNHQLANMMGYDWVWRLDDDTFAEPNVLETLCSYINDDIGAVAGSILTPSFMRDIQHKSGFSGKLTDVFTSYNLQWLEIKELVEVEHLHCSFLYRAGVANYNLNLSRVAHGEETMFSNSLYRKGYKLLLVPNSKTWHLKVGSGGIRSTNKEKYYDFDENIFKKYVNNEKVTVVVLDNGRGDHICFKQMMHEIENPIIFSCYPEIVPGYSIAEALDLFVNIDNYNIYQKMHEWNWDRSIEDAFRKLYVENI